MRGCPSTTGWRRFVSLEEVEGTVTVELLEEMTKTRNGEENFSEISIIYGNHISIILYIKSYFPQNKESYLVSVFFCSRLCCNVFIWL